MSVIKLEGGIELPYPDRARNAFTRPAGISERRWKAMKPDMWQRAYTHCLFVLIKHLEDPLHSIVPHLARKMLEASDPMLVALRFMGEMRIQKYIKFHVRKQRGKKDATERVVMPYKKLLNLELGDAKVDTTAITMPHIVGDGRIPSNFVVRNGISSRKNRKAANVVFDIAKEVFTIDQYMLSIIDMFPPDKVSAKDFKSYYMLNRTRTTAKKLLNQSFMYPYFLCSRSRMYQNTTCGVSPQGADFEKAVLRPLYSEVLTTNGYLALLETAKGYSEQEWTPQEMADHSRFPSKHMDIWKDANKPYMYLATANMIRMYLDNPDQPIPAFIPLDGRCSGLQHWSGMTRSDSITKHLGMELEESDEDIYERSAREWGENLLDKFKQYATRKAAKIPVMTWGYNATQMTTVEHLDSLFGAKQVWNVDKECYETVGEGLIRADTGTLGRDLYQRLNITLSDLKEAVDWMSEAASTIAKAGNTDIYWVTPDGFECKQRKVKGTKKVLKVGLSNGEALELQVLDFSGNIPDSRRHKSAIAPDVIHSMDATHLRMVARRLTAMGLPMIFIHDSFATHVNYRDKLYNIIVEEFARLYDRNYLLDLALYWTEKYKVDVGVPPKLGNWEPKTVLKLKRFFL